MKGGTQRVNQQLVAGSKNSSSSRIALLSNPRENGLLDARMAPPSAACGILSNRPGRRRKGIGRARLCLSRPNE